MLFTAGGLVPSLLNGPGASHARPDIDCGQALAALLLITGGCSEIMSFKFPFPCHTVPEVYINYLHPFCQKLVVVDLNIRIRILRDNPNL